MSHPSPQPSNSAPAIPHLRRVLKLRDLIIYGIIVIQPIAAVPLFGVAQKLSRGHTVTTILIAMLAMMLTAASYGRMAALYPSAGSAYTYVGRGLNWFPDAGATLRLDLEASQKFFGIDKNGAYADMSIAVDLDALTMTWSVAGATPHVPAAKHFQQDLLGQAAGEARQSGPLLRVPDSPAKVNIDPRQKEKPATGSSSFAL